MCFDASSSLATVCKAFPFTFIATHAISLETAAFPARYCFVLAMLTVSISVQQGQPDHTAADYYFDSYAHFGKLAALAVLLCSSICGKV